MAVDFAAAYCLKSNHPLLLVNAISPSWTHGKPNDMITFFFNLLAELKENIENLNTETGTELLPCV